MTNQNDALYRDWELLFEIDHDLKRLASQFGVTLPVGDDTSSRQRRAKGLEEIMLRLAKEKEAHPASWNELADRLYASVTLNELVKGRWRYKESDSHDRDDIMQEVRWRIYCVIIRRAGKWYADGDRDNGDWGGYVRRQINQLVERASKRCDNTELPGLEDRIPDRRELAPLENAIWRETACDTRAPPTVQGGQ